MEGKGGGATKKDPKMQGTHPVHQMMIFEEMVHKEVTFLKTQKGREYTVNPFTMAVISDKPNYVTPKQPFLEKPHGQRVKEVPANDDVVDRAFRFEAMKRQIQSAGL